MIPAPTPLRSFTWPSRGSIFEYGYDRRGASFSRDALEETLRRIARDPGVADVTVMAHSMGAWLVMETCGKCRSATAA